MRFNQKGYTLIELVVAVAIFVTVVVSVTAIFIDTLRANKRAAQERALVDQTQSLVDQIHRDLFTAQADYFGTYNCLGTGITYPRAFSQATTSQIIFIDEEGICSGYALDSGQVVKLNNITDVSATTTTIIPMTDPSIKVNKLSFRIFEDGFKAQQPLVQYLVSVESLNADNLPVVSLQGSMSFPLRAQYNTCSVGIGSEGVFCPLREEDFPNGTVVVDFLTDSCDLGDVSLDSCIKGDTTTVNGATTQFASSTLPAGTYKVVLVGHDAHKLDALGTSLAATQTDEQFFVHLNSTDSSYALRTTSTPELRDQDDCMIAVVDESLTITDSIEEAQACHAAPTWVVSNDCATIQTAAASPNELRAVCAAFIPTN